MKFTRDTDYIAQEVRKRLDQGYLPYWEGDDSCILTYPLASQEKVHESERWCAPGSGTIFCKTFFNCGHAKAPFGDQHRSRFKLLNFRRLFNVRRPRLIPMLNHLGQLLLAFHGKMALDSVSHECPMAGEKENLTDQKNP